MKRNGRGLLLLVVMVGLAVLTSAATPDPESSLEFPVVNPTPTATVASPPENPPTTIPQAGEDNFSEAKILFPVPLHNWNMGITIQMPANIRGEYRAVVGETFKEYTCAPETDYQRPNWLFCYGRLPAVDKRVPFQVLEKSSGTQVFRSEIYIPLSILYSEIL